LEGRGLREGSVGDEGGAERVELGEGGLESLAAVLDFDQVPRHQLAQHLVSIAQLALEHHLLGLLQKVPRLLLAMLVEDADLQPRVVELYQELVLRVEWGAGVGHREVLGLQLLLACIELVILLARECLLEKPAFTIGTLILKRNCAWVLLVSRSLDGMVGLAKLVLAVGEGAVDHELAEVVLHPGLAELGLEVVVGHAAYSQDHLPRQGLEGDIEEITYLIPRLSGEDALT